MEGSAPPAKRGRLEPFDGDGFYFGDDLPSANDANNPNKVIGSRGTATTDGVNDDLDCKLLIIPAEFPANNTLSDRIPCDSLVFGRNFRFHAPEYRPNQQVTDFVMRQGGQRYLMKEHERLQVATPEHLNAILHRDALHNIRADHHERSLEKIFKEWQPIGIMVTPSVKKENQEGRQTTERVVNLRPITDGKVINHGWADNVNGDLNAHLHIVLQYADIGPSTTYFVEQSLDAPAITLSDQVMDQTLAEDDAEEFINTCGENLNEDEIAQVRRYFSKVTFVPRLVAMYSQSKHLPLSAKKYTVTTTSGRKIEGVGMEMYIGRCTANPAFDKRSMVQNTNGSMMNIGKAMALPRLDVLVNVNNTLLN
jgi:hypothetical protein